MPPCDDTLPRLRKHKLSFEQVEAIRAECAAGASQTEVAKKYGVAACTVNKLVKGSRRALQAAPHPSRAEVKANNKARHLAWRRANAEHVRLKGRLSQHKLRGASGSVSVEEWLAIVETFDGRCAYCGVRDVLVIEHVTPLSAGGTNTADNVVPACGACNHVKGKQGPLALVNRNFQLRVA